LEYQETMQEYDKVHQECYKKIVEVVFTLMDTRKGRLGGSWYGNEEENCRKRGNGEDGNGCVDGEKGSF